MPPHWAYYRALYTTVEALPMPLPDPLLKAIFGNFLLSFAIARAGATRHEAIGFLRECKIDCRRDVFKLRGGNQVRNTNALSYKNV